MDLKEAIGTTKIEVIVTAKGCPEACLHCGAYQDFDKHDYIMEECSSEQLKDNLTREIKEIRGGTKLIIADLLANFVTTDVNTEPLRGTAFCNLAELVYELSEGSSQLVCISHGVRYSSKQMKEEMLKVVELMEKGIVPLFVLSVDLARGKGMLSRKANLKGYTKTLEMLKPVLDLIAKKKETGDSSIPTLRVTISLQGVDEENNLLYRGKAEEMFQEVLKRVGFTKKQRDALYIDKGRQYAKVGRAGAKIFDSIGEGECPVIPDADFVDKCLEHEHLFRAKVEMDGNVYRQANNPNRSYNDTVAGRWELLNGNGDEAVTMEDLEKEEPVEEIPLDVKFEIYDVIDDDSDQGSVSAESLPIVDVRRFAGRSKKKRGSEFVLSDAVPNRKKKDLSGDRRSARRIRTPRKGLSFRKGLSCRNTTPSMKRLYTQKDEDVAINDDGEPNGGSE